MESLLKILFCSVSKQLNTSLLSLTSAMANYTAFVHGVKLWEANWACNENGVRERSSTFEQEITTLEKGPLASTLCTQKQVLESYGLSLDMATAQAEAILSSVDPNPPSFSYGDMYEYILFNSLSKFVDYQLEFFASALQMHFL